MLDNLGDQTLLVTDNTNTDRFEGFDNIVIYDSSSKLILFI